MTTRSLRFILTALFGTILVALTLALSYRDLMTRNLTEMGAEKNAALGRSLSNALRPLLHELLDPNADLDFSTRHDLVEAIRFSAALDEQVRDLSVVKIKVYSTSGLTVFSTERKQIGEDQSDNPGVASALAGEQISDIVHRDKFNAFDKVIEQRDLIQTYLPLRNEAGAVDGVFEIYSDVTPLLFRIAGAQRRIVIGVIGILGTFYLVLVVIFRRTDRKLRQEREKTRRYLEDLEAANDTLEERVAERTRALRKSEHFVQTAMDGIPDPAVVIDKEFRITLMNRAAREIFVNGDPHQSLVCYRAMHGRDAPCDDTAHPCPFLTGESGREIQTHISDDGVEYLVEITTTPLRGADGEVSGVIEVAHNLSEREQIALNLRQEKESAEAASRTKTEFVATISHEIRTPMNAVLGMTDLLQLTNLTRKQRTYTQIIQSSGDMLLSLVDNVLEYAKAGTGPLLIRKHEFDIIDLIERVLEIMGYQAYSKGIELAGSIEADVLLRVVGDQYRLRQILINLINNAIKFTDEGEVMFSVAVESETDERIALLFSVTDTGIGISAGAGDHLFKPFIQVDPETPSHPHGSGLGLTICKRLVEAMDGDIGIDSRRRVGARFWFTVSFDKVALPKDRDYQQTKRLSGQRALIVDDNAEIGAVTLSYMDSFGMHCELINDANEAMSRLQASVDDEKPFNFVVVDVDMPRTGGILLSRQIRAESSFAELPIVLLTSIANPLEVGEISGLSRVLCINKPVLLSDLHSALLELAGSDGSQAPTSASRLSLSGSVRDAKALRILVAEDNQVNNQLLVEMLRSLNYRPDSVADGPSVLTRLAERPYDLILMDCQMTGMDGEVVTREIRSNPRRYRMQPIIIAVTANASPDHRRRCLRAGMNDLIAKPIRLEKLADGLRNTWLALRQDRDRDGSSVGRQVCTQVKDRVGKTGGIFLDNYIDLFVKDAVSRLNKLTNALQNNDRETLARECHALKGACLELGITKLGNCCDVLRDAARHAEPGTLSAALDRLEKEFDRIRPVLESEKTGAV